jgi:hypothetical protein
VTSRTARWRPWAARNGAGRFAPRPNGGIPQARTFWVAISSALIALALAAPASAQFSPGARTLGEPYLFLQHLGNGGYDAQHYDGKAITVSDAEGLLADATRIEAAMGC